MADVLQLRAVARDANDVSGPGLGSSETRAIRVARAGEYDSVSVDPAPPGEPEGQVLSQRMLINLTEALERRRPSLAALSSASGVSLPPAASIVLSSESGSAPVRWKTMSPTFLRSLV